MANTLRQRQQQSLRRGGPSAGVAVTKLSMDYRAAMCECLMRLQDKAQTNGTGNNNNDGSGGGDAGMKDDDEERNNNMELLSLTYAISHLAEIFLLPSLASTMDSGFHDQTFDAVSSRIDGPAGSLTADTVRYLRLHHSAGSVLDSPEVVKMLESDQPEHYQFPPSFTTGNNILAGPYDHPYWNLLLTLIVQGQLSDAWNLLSYHSACRHAEDEAEDGGELSPEGQGFAALRALLMSAPVPGGRGDAYCDDAGLDDYLEEESLEQAEDENDGEEKEYGEDPGDINQLWIDGVPPNSYLLWESLPRRADKLRTLRYRRDLRRCGGRIDDEGAELESYMVPEVYQPRVAMNAFRIWQETIRVTAFPSGGGRCVLSALFQRFPPLPQILSILLGTIPPSIVAGGNTTSGGLTWSQVLLVELLYARPEMTPEDIATRARVAMSKGSGGGNRPFQEIILSIMNGGAGQVVETMFSLCGGSSGAALPATMTSLLCSLLVDAGYISAQKDVPASSPLNIQAELLVLAAESILSSFSVQEQSDVGVRTAIRLLLPNAPPKQDHRARSAADNAESYDTEDDIIYEPRIAAMIAEALSHRLPSTDAEARDLLELCEEMVRLGSLLIADACESLAFSRALHHNRSNSGNSNFTREVYWLLRGMEVQSCWLPEQRRRTLGFACRRRFDSLCEGSANDLIAMLSVAAITNFSKTSERENHEKELSSALQAAEDILEGVLQDEAMVPVLKGHLEANLLQYTVDVALADAKGDTVRVAADIVHCLEERCLSEGDHGGVVSTLADPKLYPEFLCIAFALLVKEDSSQHGRPMEFASCAFTVHGIHILMARLTQVLSCEGILCSSPGPLGASPSNQPSLSKKEYFSAMRLAFSKGLMRAFVSHGPSTAMKTGSKKRGGEVSMDEELELLLSPCI